MSRTSVLILFLIVLTSGCLETMEAWPALVTVGR